MAQIGHILQEHGPRGWGFADRGRPWSKQRKPVRILALRCRRTRIQIPTGASKLCASYHRQELHDHGSSDDRSCARMVWEGG